MSAAYRSPEAARGAQLLLAHCAAVNLGEGGRTPVLDRLREQLGPDLTRLLLVALAGDHRTRSRSLSA
jgi:hypothetical protein